MGKKWASPLDKEGAIYTHPLPVIILRRSSSRGDSVEWIKLKCCLCITTPFSNLLLTIGTLAKRATFLKPRQARPNARCAMSFLNVTPSKLIAATAS